jgi:hypothetical protein
MRKVFLTVMAVFLLAACAGTPEKISLVEDPGSPAKVALLRERVKAFWTAYVDAEYEKAFALYDTFFQAKTNRMVFIGRLGRIKYKGFEIKDMNVEGNVAHVSVNIVYSIPPTKFKKQEFSQPETLTTIEETWLYIYDNWYKEYQSEGDSTSGRASY